MIKIENLEVRGWEAAIRGMRNPMNSWEKSDSEFEDVFDDAESLRTYYQTGCDIGPNDHDLMMRLAKAGTEHSKYRRMLVVYVDITAPLYWWKEFDTYKVGTVANSCSTMHKIHAKEFTLEDFSCEHLLRMRDITPTDIIVQEIDDNLNSTIKVRECLPCIAVGTDVWVEPFSPFGIFRLTIEMLNRCRELYLETKDKRYWWQMIQLLPTSYNQRRTVMLNYENLAAIYRQRQGHKLDEWHDFCAFIEQLPYSEIITLKEV